MEEMLKGTPRSVRELEYKAPNYRRPDAWTSIINSSMGATVSDGRPKSAMSDAQKTPKKPIKDLSVHPEWGKVNLKDVTDQEFVSTYMHQRDGFMKDKNGMGGATRAMKASGNSHVWGFGNTQGSGGVTRSCSDW